MSNTVITKHDSWAVIRVLVSKGNFCASLDFCKVIDPKIVRGYVWVSHSKEQNSFKAVADLRLLRYLWLPTEPPKLSWRETVTMLFCYSFAGQKFSLGLAWRACLCSRPRVTDEKVQLQ